ncbi:MMPL family transporter [Actinomadura parmotrematis]|uniref:MMPL family transporter n=1 Tax=Actinomadura parmotrematis TaxID=2864039 RepID=A0ABS7FXX8_9ACTN|nr:MMPL family transporter [Actinomadura parmotrematis]MBW8485161.1 MMPL family transporter [Actinomadura parmotrematis]
MTNLPVRMARWSARHPWRAIAAWFLFVFVCLGAGVSAGGHAATSADYRVGEAGRAEAMAEQGGLQRKPFERVLITAPDAGRRAAAEAAAREVTARMKGLPEVESVAPPARSADGRSLRVDVTLRGPELDGKKHVEPVLARTAAVAGAHPDLRIDESGSPSSSKDVQGRRGADLSRTEMIALPVTLLVLLLVPVLLAATSIAAAIGLSMLASHLVPDSGVGANVILLIGMAVGVDYTLFYLKRAREERDRAGGALDRRAVVELAAASSPAPAADDLGWRKGADMRKAVLIGVAAVVAVVVGGVAWAAAPGPGKAQVSQEQYRTLAGQCRYAEKPRACRDAVGKKYRVGKADAELACRAYGGVTLCGTLGLSAKEKTCADKAVRAGMARARAEAECYLYS